MVLFLFIRISGEYERSNLKLVPLKKKKKGLKLIGLRMIQ